MKNNLNPSFYYQDLSYFLHHAFSDKYLVPNFMWIFLYTHHIFFTFFFFLRERLIDMQKTKIHFNLFQDIKLHDRVGAWVLFGVFFFFGFGCLFFFFFPFFFLFSFFPFFFSLLSLFSLFLLFFLFLFSFVFLSLL